MSDTEQVKTAETTPEQIQAEADTALRAGYQKASGGEPDKPEVAAPETPEKVEAKEETTAEQPAAQPDPWAGVNPALKEMLENISTRVSEVDKLGQRFKSFEGRLGAVQNAMAAANAAAKATGTQAPTEKQLNEAMQSTEKWDALMADMTDWKEAFEERLAAHAATLTKNAPVVDVESIKQQLETSFSQSLDAVRKASTQEARQLAQVDIKHPDWEQQVKTPEYAAWFKTQAPEIQALVDSDRAADAIKHLDLYAEHRKAVEKQIQNQQRLAAVVAPKQANSGGPTVLPDEAGLAIGYKRAKRA